jgi:hypothetical protein
MLKDLNDSFVGDGLWTHARNAVNNSHLGEQGVLGNEQSNELCITAPYDIIGVLDIQPGEWLIMSTNDTDSEIGILQEATCKYVKLANDRCLGFKKSNLITGAVKSNYDCTYSAYWADGLNPDRFMNLSHVPYKYTVKEDPNNPGCLTKVYSTQLDCEKLLLHPHLKSPCIDLRKGKGAGQLPNGTYQAAVAYSVNGLRVTDYFTPSNAQGLFTHENVAGSLEVVIENLDDQFDEYELVMIGFINQNVTARKIGNYSTSQKTVQLDNYSASLEVIPYRLIPLLNNVYEKSSKMFSLNGYLLRSGVTTKPDFNYQPLANKIRAKWVSVEYPSDYYVKGGHIMSYMRDEQYAFFIRWVYNTGHKSASYHIPGRPPVDAVDRKLVSPTDGDVLDTGVEKEEWQVRNTATVTALSPGLTAADSGYVLAEGDMGYWESTEQYPADKPQIWGDLCGKKIRHHRFPDTYTDGSDVTNIHDQGGQNIRVLGVRFESIEHPLDFFGNPIAEIVGYEILRGTREGNRTIVAKGLINNMREYSIPGKSSKGLYQNYPFNDLGADRFHRKYGTFDEFYSSGRGDDDTSNDALTEYRKDMFSFHSPDTNFRNPYLSTYELKLHHVEHGTSTGRFKYVYQHPKFRLLNNGALITASILSGIAIANAIISETPVTVGGTDDIPMTTVLSPGVNGMVGVSTNSLLPGQLLAAGAFAISAFDMINENILQAITLLSKYRDYALQVDQVGEYNQSVENIAGNKRRRVNRSNYVDPTLMQFGGTHRINNMFRNRFVGVEVSNDVADPSVTDNSRRLITDVNENVGEDFTTTVSSYYTSLKVDFQNQYGQIANISQVPVTQCVYSTEPLKRKKFSSPVIFGGDIYINRYTEKNSMFFFNTNACGYPDGTTFDYRTNVNIPFPRYWVDSNKYEGLLGGNNGDILNYPSDYRSLNRKSGNGFTFSVKNAYFYLFNSGVREFFVESEVNLAHRDWGERMSERHYDRYTFTSTDELFRSDIVATGNYYKYDYSLSFSKSIQQYGSWGYVLPSLYDPYVSQTCFANREKRVLYSLQRQAEGVKDNWRVYLANNYKDFNSRVSAIKAINKTGAIILYEDAEPTQFVGVDQLQTDAGTKITIGDGGLFNQALQSLVNADDTMQYGSCLSGRSAVNTPHGTFYVSEETGKILNYTGSGLDEISRNGMNYWFQKYLPSKLLQRYPNFRGIDNPVAGIGAQTVYDPQYELVYFSKVDYIPLNPEVKYDPDYGFYTEYPVTVKVPGETTIGCAAGYTLKTTPSGVKFCEKIETVTATEVPTSYSVTPYQRPDWGYLGTAVYDTGWNSNGTGAGHTPGILNTNGYSVIPYSNTFWYNTTYTLNPVNRLSVWDASGITTPGERGFSFNVCINQTKTYYVALTGDNKFTLKIDGNIILEADAAQMCENHNINPSDGRIQFQRLHIYPIEIEAGNHLLELIGWNQSGSVGMIGAEIYDNTASEIIAATSYSMLNVIFTTRDKTTFTANNYICPLDYTLGLASNCTTPICRRVLTAPVQEVTLPDTEKVVYKRRHVTLDDPQYFTRCSWTISYDPKNKMWISFHDWHPDLMIQPHEHFMTVKGPSVYKHNKRWDSYCNFYGVDYPFEVEFPTSTANTITTIRNGEYVLENYIFSNDGMSAHEVLDHNFDQAVVYNNEQISGALNLVLKPKSDPIGMLTYPRINANNIDILFSKEENTYRFNQFWDITKDRGEFTTTRTPMWLTDCNGYVRKINSDYVNYNKAPLERKKFRHYADRFILIRKISGNVKMLLKMFTTKKLHSPR